MKEEWLFGDNVDAEQIWETNGLVGEKRKYLKQVQWNIYTWTCHISNANSKMKFIYSFGAILNIKTTYYPVIPFLIT